MSRVTGRFQAFRSDYPSRRPSGAPSSRGSRRARPARDQAARQRCPCRPRRRPYDGVCRCTPDRCQFHLQQNARAYVPRRDLMRVVPTDTRGLFNASDAVETNRLLQAKLKRFEKSAPRLVKWTEENLPQGFTLFNYPEPHRSPNAHLQRAQTAEQRNCPLLEGGVLFPNTNACLRLVTAVVMEISEEWETQGKSI